MSDPTPVPASRGALDAEIETLNLLADAARRATAPFFRAHDLIGENKAARGFDPVTEADRASERAMRAILAERHPQDGVIGEELGRHAGESGRVWVLDPIDGTRAFLSGLPLWGVLIGLYDGARPALGAMDQPYLEERYVGVSVGAASATLHARSGVRALRRRPCPALAEATLYSTDPGLFSGAELEAFQNVSERARLVRYGTDCYGYAMIAAGHGDLVIESGLKPYDIHALIPIIEAAGGVVTDWSGGPAFWGGQVLAAGDARVHAEALALLALAATAPAPRPF